MDEIFNFSKLITTLMISICGFLYLMGKWAEDSKKPDIGKSIAKKIENFNITPTFDKAYSLTSHIADSIFGEKIITIRSIITSLKFTSGWIVFISALIFIFQWKQNWIYSWLISSFVLKNFWYYVLLGIVIDFLSVCLTRSLLKYALNKSNTIKIMVLFLDTILSIALFYLSLSGFKYIIYHQYLGIFDSIQSWLQQPAELFTIIKFLQDASFTPTDSGYNIQNGNTELIYAFPEGIFFISSLLTSIWIWLHVSSSLTLSLSKKWQQLKNYLFNLSNVQSKPYASMTSLIIETIIIPVWLLSILLYTTITIIDHLLA